MQKTNRLWSVLFIPVILILISSAIAFSDGGYIWKQTFLGQAKSGGQQAIIINLEDKETLVLQTDYEGELAEFSWIIPVPSLVTINDVSEADDNAFYWLDDITAPSFYSEELIDTGGCSCGAGGAGSGSDAGPPNQDYVEVLETILTETYEVNVLSATSAQDLLDWLDQNDYKYPEEAGSVFEDYLDRGWYFLAVRINPSNIGDIVKQALSPIQISFETSEPIFPLLISSLSSESETEILIHFISNHRFKTSNATSKEIDYVDSPIEGSDDHTVRYQNWMKNQVQDWDGRLYHVEYAGWLMESDCLAVNGYLNGGLIDCNSDIFVTRFRSYYSPGFFKDDIYFEQDTDDNHFDVMIKIWDSRSVTRSSLFMVSLILFIITFVNPRKKLSNSAKNITLLGLLMILCSTVF